jgi:hypothetical protein
MRRKEEKVFFSEEKKQKTLRIWAEPIWDRPKPELIKAFCFLFSKKKTFLVS